MGEQLRRNDPARRAETDQGRSQGAEGCAVRRRPEVLLDAGGPDREMQAAVHIVVENDHDGRFRREIVQGGFFRENRNVHRGNEDDRVVVDDAGTEAATAGRRSLRRYALRKVQIDPVRRDHLLRRRGRLHRQEQGKTRKTEGIPGHGALFEHVLITRSRGFLWHVCTQYAYSYQENKKKKRTKILREEKKRNVLVVIGRKGFRTKKGTRATAKSKKTHGKNTADAKRRISYTNNY